MVVRRALLVPPAVAAAGIAVPPFVGRGLRQGIAEDRVQTGPVHRAPTGPLPVGHSSSSADNWATTYETSGHSVAMPSRIAARLGARLATTVLPETPT